MPDDDAQKPLGPQYQALRELARARLSRLPPGQTLQATELVHEAWLRLGELQPQTDRAAFFAAAAQAMRDILVEAVRRRQRLKRGGNLQRSPAEPDALPDLSRLALPVPLEDLLSLDQQLDALGRAHPRPARVVLLKWFSGLGHKEIAAMLEVTERTVERDWRFARAWLRDRLGPEFSLP